MKNWKRIVYKVWLAFYVVAALITLLTEYKDQTIETLISIAVFQLIGACILCLVSYGLGITIEHVFKFKSKENT